MENNNDYKIFRIQIINQMRKCYLKYGAYASFHEAMSILREEFEELWDECKKKEHNFENIESEIIDCITVLEKMYFDVVLINKRMKELENE